MKRGLLSALAIIIGASFANADVKLICRLSPAAKPADVANKYRVRLLDVTAGAPFAYFSAANEAAADAAAVLMKADPAVVWVEDDDELTTPEGQKGSTLPAVGDRAALHAANTQFLSQINWSSSLAQAPGRAVKVAILDTGLSPRQTYLWNKVSANMNAIERTQPAWDWPRKQDTNGDGKVDNMVGHGTMVAGIIDMISPKSRLVIARVADSDGVATAWNLIKGLAFAVTSGAEVANVSLGTMTQVPALTDVLDWCEEQNLLVVGAIGNGNVRGACYPARISKVVAVGGLFPDNTKAPFSNWDGRCLVSGPATGITSQDWNGKFGVWSGTSFSTPMATAVAAEAMRASAGRVPLPALRLAYKKQGSDLDRANPKYRAQLGRLLDFTRFVTFFRAKGP